MRQRMLLIMVGLFFLLNSCSESTSPDIEEFSTIDQKLFENLSTDKIIKTSDNCLMIAGSDSNNVLTFIKMDLDGNILNRTLYPEADYSHPQFLIETSDNGLIVAFQISNDSRIMKFDTQGNLVWEKELGNTDQLKVMLDLENNIIIVDRMMVRKLDASGNIIWYGFYFDQYAYVYDDVRFDVHYLYDSTVRPNGDIMIIYKSPICDLVKIFIDKDGNFISGDHYYIDIKTNALLYSEGSYNYIIGCNEDMNGNSQVFIMDLFNYSWDWVSDTFDELTGFNDILKSINITENGDILITSLNDNIVMSLDPFKRTLNWYYSLNDLESYNSPQSYDTIEIKPNLYATVLNVGLPNNDTDLDGTIIRFFRKN